MYLQRYKRSNCADKLDPPQFSTVTKKPSLETVNVASTNFVMFYIFVVYLQRWSRGHKARGQGQGHQKNPRSRTAFPRTEPLEAKDSNARGQGHRRKRSPKKKGSLKIFFTRSSNHWRTQNFLLGEV